ATMEYLSVLVEELSAFMNKEGNVVSVARHDDTVMSLAFAVYYITKFSPISMSATTELVPPISESDVSYKPKRRQSGVVVKNGEAYWVDEDEVLDYSEEYFNI
ncbi:MAG TPA: hypothetical protein PKY72_04435, partial [Bacilli bacterium]|nr:hypothetical protein [Bacilli bacterium]